MDEVLVGDWKKDLPEALKFNITRPIHNFVYGWNDDGTPSVSFDGVKVHARRGYRWRFPIHEAVCAYKIPETRAKIDLTIHHFPQAILGCFTTLVESIATVKDFMMDYRP
jgi:hypothetical protein